MTRLLRSAIAFVLVAGGAGAAFAQGAPAGDKPPSAEMQKEMEAMQKAGALGAEHAKLKSLAGTYDAVVTFWMEPGAPPQQMQGKAEFKTVLADHFLQQDYSGSMMGQPFTGMMLVGYDNVLKKYRSIWLDSMGTGFYTGSGTADKAGNLVFNTLGPDPVKGKEVKGRDVWKLETGKLTYEMYGTPRKGGKEYKMMEIVYTRK